MGKQSRQRRERNAIDRPTSPPPTSRSFLWLAVAAAAILTVYLLARSRSSQSENPPTRPSPAVAHAIEIAEHEPNDHRPQSLDTTAPVIVRGKIEGNDVDQYQVKVDPDGGWLLFASVDSAATTTVDVTAADGKALARAQSPDRISALGVVGGPYLIQVRSGGATQPDTEYRLHVDIQPWTKGKDWEPDDDPSHAQDMAPVEDDSALFHFRASGWWSSADDIDCFKLPLQTPAKGARLAITVRPPAGAAAALAVYDSGDEQAKAPPRKFFENSGEALGKPLLVPTLGARSWDSFYVLCVRAARGVNRAERYSIDVTGQTPDSAFEFEPNDSRQLASALALGIPVRGYLSRRDEDWFRISSPAQARMDVSVTVPAGLTADVTLLDRDARELANTRTVDGRGHVQADRAAFVRLRDLSGGRTDSTYELTATIAH